jgi:signal transduction histidine kinase
MKESVNEEHTGAAGTGLGLSLVSRICDHLGVHLHVVSHPDRGTVFHIDFSSVLTKS